MARGATEFRDTDVAERLEFRVWVLVQFEWFQLLANVDLYFELLGHAVLEELHLVREHRTKVFDTVDWGEQRRSCNGTISAGLGYVPYSYNVRIAARVGLQTGKHCIRDMDSQVKICFLGQRNFGVNSTIVLRTFPL